MECLPEHARFNRAYWDEQASDWVAAGERNWAVDEPRWGIWGMPETDLRLLPGDMNGMDAIELGCGTGYVSGWMARRGARVVGVDISAEQLRTARRLAEQHRVEVDLRRGFRRGSAVPRRVLRLRHQRIRGCHVVRPSRVDTGGAPAAPPQRRARLHVQLDPVGRMQPRRRPGRGAARTRLLPAPPPRLAPGRRRHRVQPPRVGVVPPPARHGLRGRGLL